MLKFWDALTTFISNFTIDDAASAISIIEGFATVVAAIGAIIAVVVTKKIAKEQIEIAKNQNNLFIEQNKIAASQVKIAEQQNQIALYKLRYEVFELISFLVRFSDIGVKLGFENEMKWDLNHRAKMYFMFWLQEFTTVKDYPELILSYISIWKDTKQVGWALKSNSNIPLSVTKSTFIKINRSEVNLLQERKHLFNKKVAVHLEDIAIAYGMFCREIARSANFDERTQENFTEEPYEGCFQRISFWDGVLEETRNMFQEKIEHAKQSGLLPEIEKVITID